MPKLLALIIRTHAAMALLLTVMALHAEQFIIGSIFAAGTALLIYKGERFISHT